jgi:hypothetical protein
MKGYGKPGKNIFIKSMYLAETEDKSCDRRSCQILKQKAFVIGIDQVTTSHVK